jgi:hypothetical protein
VGIWPEDTACRRGVGGSSEARESGWRRWSGNNNLGKGSGVGVEWRQNHKEDVAMCPMLVDRVACLGLYILASVKCLYGLL